MKLKVQLATSEGALSLEQSGNRVAAEVDGRHYDLEVRQLDPHEYLLLFNTKLYACRVEPSRGTFSVHVRGRRYEITIIDPKRLRGSTPSGGHDQGSVRILSSMAGKVVRVLVEPGSQVEAGAGLVVVEAMKMQNEMKAPKAGTVSAIHVMAGETVNAGDALAVVE